MEPWYKVVAPRKEVREGRSFSPDEFAIALEQVVAGRAPDDYKNPDQFFERTCFTKALCENTSLVLRRLAGQTSNTAPVQTLITQMGGGKTHMLTALWHLLKSGTVSKKYQGVETLLREAELPIVPAAKVAVFVGNAWDPQPGKETPWIDIARQLAGEEGVKALGSAAKEAPPGTETLNRVIDLAKGPVVLLFDELLNFFNRHKAMADPMHAFIHNIVRGFIGTNHRSAVFSLPRSEVEMTKWDQEWQDKIVKVVGAVAKPLLVNEEAEISEVIRRRLFENTGSERIRKNVAKAFSDWCFERRAQLPPEWTAVDVTATEKKAKEFLQERFETCYPFHPATLSVFQRKWRPLPQFQQTRGVLAMLAMWISWAYRESFTQARREPLITLGSAPLHVSEFRSEALKQLGENRLLAAIDTDLSGERSHARTLDADSKGVLRDIHRRVGTTILFESSGGQIDKVAHLPELRFALGEPEVDTTSIDNAAFGLEGRAFFLQRVGSDGFRIFHKAKIDKAVHDRKASLEEESEIKPTIRRLVQDEFKRGASITTEFFPSDSNAVSDSPRLCLVVSDPNDGWNGGGILRERIATWTKERGKSPRIYPGALVWCGRKTGRDLRDKVEIWLAWQKVLREVREGILGADFEKADLREMEIKVKQAEDDARDEIWASYRFVIIADHREPDGLKVIDLGAGHASAGETLCGRVITALKSQALLNESVGAGYIDRNWPPALKESGAWPLASIRQSFLNGALTRLIDPDAVLRNKIVEFVGRGDFGLASGQKTDGTYDRIWFEEQIPSDEVSFESGVFLLTKTKSRALKVGTKVEIESVVSPFPEPVIEEVTEREKERKPEPNIQTRTLRLVGTVPPETWNRLGTKIIPKLKSGSDLKIGVDFSVTVSAESARGFEADLKQILEDLGLKGKINIE
jgi:hypothetical protein